MKKKNHNVILIILLSNNKVQSANSNSRSALRVFSPIKLTMFVKMKEATLFSIGCKSHSEMPEF